VGTLAGLLRLCALLLATLVGHAVLAQTPNPPPVELQSLRALPGDGALQLDFAVRLNLPRAVEDALKRGVPLYFVAEAQLFRSRWYWRDERVARVQRLWRVAYQPLTGNWRVGLGGLNQSHATLPEALASASSSAGWRLADLAQVDRDKSYYVEFRYRLDSSQLPGPMQLGLGGQNDWSINLQRTLRLELPPERAPERAAERGTDRPPEKTPDKALERPAERPQDRPADRAPERLPDRPADRPGERPTEPVPPEARGEPARPEARP
jgi:hypothetical protein